MNIDRLIINSLIYFGHMTAKELQAKLKLPDYDTMKMHSKLNELKMRGYLVLEYGTEKYRSRYQWGEYDLSQNDNF